MRERTRNFGRDRGRQKLSPCQLNDKETACCHESGGTHVEQKGGPTDDPGKRRWREERINRIATREEMISKKERRCKQGSKGASNACRRDEEKIKGRSDTIQKSQE